MTEKKLMAPTNQTEIIENQDINNNPEVSESSTLTGSDESDGNDLETILASKPQPKQNLDRLKLYSMTDLQRLGYSIAYLKVNRDIDDKEVSKKMKSIRNANGVISPFLVVPAPECLRQALEIRDENGNEITLDCDDINSTLVLIDGQHRFEAVEKLKSDKNPMFVERYFHLPLIPDYSIMDLLSEANTATNSWDGIDYLTKFIQIAKNKGMDPYKAEQYKKFASIDMMSDSAASLWVNGEIVSKARIISMMKPDKNGSYQKMDEFLGTTNLTNRYMLYRYVKGRFGDAVSGLKITPTKFLQYVNELVNTSKKLMDDAYKYVYDFIADLSNPQIEAITNSQKTATKTKDQVLAENLDAAWNEYQENNPV